MNKEIALGNYKDKCVYYDLNEYKYTFTYLKSDSKVIRNWSLVGASIGTPLVKALNDIFIINNIVLKIIFLIICACIIMFLTNKYVIKFSKNKKFEFYESKDKLKDLLILWKKQTIMSIVFVIFAILISLGSAIYYLMYGKFFALFIFAFSFFFLAIVKLTFVDRLKMINILLK